MKLYVAGGIAEPVIAHQLKVCQNTLRKHFAEELAFGRGMKLAHNLERLDKAADDGNVSAMKHLDTKFAEVAADHHFTGAAPILPGKKEIAQRDAETAGLGSEWGSDLDIPPLAN